MYAGSGAIAGLGAATLDGDGGATAAGGWLLGLRR